MTADATRYYRNERRDILPFVPRPCGRALDVGCGAGGFGAALKGETGAIVHGIEPRADVAEEARSVLDDVHVGVFDERSAAGLSGGTPYSCIVFNDVLEHMEVPSDALVVARDNLAPDGAVVASIPNFRNWQTLDTVVRLGTFAYADKGVLDRTHLRFFCRADIHDLFISNGFRVDAMEGISPLNLRNWQRWHLVSRLIGHGLPEDGRYVQFVVVARPR